MRDAMRPQPRTPPLLTPRGGSLLNHPCFARFHHFELTLALLLLKADGAAVDIVGVILAGGVLCDFAERLE